MNTGDIRGPPQRCPSLAALENRKEVELGSVAQSRGQRHYHVADRSQPNLVFRVQAIDNLANRSPLRQVKLNGRNPVGQKATEIPMHIDLDPDHVLSARSAAEIFSAVIGSDLGQQPVAAAIAFPMAAGG